MRLLQGDGRNMSYSDFCAKLDIVMMSNKEAINYILDLYDSYNSEKAREELYRKGNDISENIIALYYYFVFKNNPRIVYGKYKRKFINNESIVEPGVTPEEKKGLGEIYDYLSKYPLDNPINICQEATIIHRLLYSHCPNSGYGVGLREATAVLYDMPYEVPDARKAMQEFYSYACSNITYTEDQDIFEYIDNCVKLTTDLIGIQPFADGNKRTFRALLNLLLKQVNIPPIYIRKEEREPYKKGLIKALCEKDYTDICKFYHYKVSDAIVDLEVSVFDKLGRDEKRKILVPKKEK